MTGHPAKEDEPTLMTRARMAMITTASASTDTVDDLAPCYKQGFATATSDDIRSRVGAPVIKRELRVGWRRQKRLRGVETLKSVHALIDEMLFGYDIAVCDITSYSSHLAGVMHMLTSLPMNLGSATLGDEVGELRVSANGEV
ncbi:hypothetical protein EV401DRAFT_2202903 [Pisolithus croceorrhizus]|nr:hypothetical protein EV401DRAFT_2202903 [Pisolithus croceorrhizus]